MIAEMDARRIERVLRNLLGNALDHAEGRPVTVRVGADDASVAVTVRDQGVGLRPGEAALVFNRFWRADPSRSRLTGGTGLGLAISLEDVRLHHGWLQAWGARGRGAVFRMTLPRVAGGPLTARRCRWSHRRCWHEAAGSGCCWPLGLLAGCTGVPTDSAPLVVRTVGPDRPGRSADQHHPAGRAPPRDIVTDFLTAGGGRRRRALPVPAVPHQRRGPQVAGQHRDGGRRDHRRACRPSPGRAPPSRCPGAGSASSTPAGVFSPSLKGTGVGDQETFTFDLVQVDGQWRIDQLQPGVLISQSAFERSYQPRKLYFYDLSETILVPDLRYCALSGQALGTWLLTALLAGPRPELAQSVINEVPDQVGRPTVVDSDPILVEMPGTSQLDANGRDRLAAQLAYTLAQIRFVPGAQLEADRRRPAGGHPGRARGRSSRPSTSPRPARTAWRRACSPTSCATAR